MERKNAWKTYSEEDISKLNAISAEYVKFLDNGKTERECVTETVAAAKAAGYIDLNDAIKAGRPSSPATRSTALCSAAASRRWRARTAATTFA